MKYLLEYSSVWTGSEWGKLIRPFEDLSVAIAISKSKRDPVIYKTTPVDPDWDGKSIPPVGCICEYNFYDRSGDDWQVVTILYVGSKYVIADVDGVEYPLNPNQPDNYRILCKPS